MEKPMTQQRKTPLRKKALTVLLIVGVLILLFLTARSLFFKGGSYDLTTTEGRAAYLDSLGWEIDPETESFRTVVVPDALEGIMEQYNKMQLQQGYDLNRHLGESCLQYCYDVRNYPGQEGRVVVSLYLQDGEIIAADIHSTALNGFMHGLTKSDAKEIAGA